MTYKDPSKKTIQWPDHLRSKQLLPFVLAQLEGTEFVSDKFIDRRRMARVARAVAGRGYDFVFDHRSADVTAMWFWR